MTGKTLPPDLRNQYMIQEKTLLSNLLLSPRAHVKNNKYMTCDSCYRHILKKDADKPPKFAISNGWCIGEMPHNLVNGDMNNILASSVARVRTFSNV